MGVSGNVPGTHLADDVLHLAFAGLRGLLKIDLIAFDRPAADVGGVTARGDRPGREDGDFSPGGAALLRLE